MPPEIQEAPAAKPPADNSESAPKFDLLSTRPTDNAQTASSAARTGSDVCQKILDVTDAFKLSKCLDGLNAKNIADPKEPSAFSLRLANPYSENSRTASPFTKGEATPRAFKPGSPKESVDPLKPASPDATENKGPLSIKDFKTLVDPRDGKEHPSHPGPELKPVPLTVEKNNEVDKKPGLPPSLQKNPAEAYENKQGALKAGTNVAPPIDGFPRSTDRVPSYSVPGGNPSAIPDGPNFRKTTGPSENDYTPYRPATPRPFVDPNVRPADNRAAQIPDANVKPAEFQIPKNDAIAKLERRYETNDAAKAVQMAKELGLPLAVHVGTGWCGPCINMDRNVWPKVEGTAKEKGTMQGKVVVLHLDAEASISKENAEVSKKMLEGVGGYPTIKVFNVDRNGNMSLKAQDSGGMNQSKLEGLLKKGGVK